MLHTSTSKTKTYNSNNFNNFKGNKKCLNLSTHMSKKSMHKKKKEMQWDTKAMQTELIVS